MLTLSKKTFYAVEAVLYIAYHAKATPISGNDIASAQGLSTRYLEPMMQRLVRAGILRGMRGPQGGYVLGRERRRITLADICDALQGNEATPPVYTPLGKKVLTPVSRDLTTAWRVQLADITLEQLCTKAQTANITPHHDAHATFAI